MNFSIPTSEGPVSIGDAIIPLSLFGGMILLAIIGYVAYTLRNRKYGRPKSQKTNY